MSFVILAKKVNKNNIFYISGETDKGIDCYYYILVQNEKVRQFEKIREGEKIDLTEYGTVLEKGYGEPSASVQRKMKEEYDFK